MKFILSLILIAGLSVLAQLYFPWWTITIICFLVGGIMGMRSLGSFMAGFFAIGILWGAYALYLDIQTGSIISMRMAEVFPMDLDSTLLALITAGIGALVGGLSTLTGSLGRSIFRK